MNECPICGNPISVAAVTCPACGHPLRQTAGQQMAGCGWGVMATVGVVLAVGMLNSGHVGWMLVAIMIVGGLGMMLERR